MSKHLLVISDDVIAGKLVRPGYGWSRDNNRTMIRASHLTDEAAIWFQFLRHSLMPTAHDGTVDYERCILLYCILNECPVDLGRIAHDSLAKVASRVQTRLIFPYVITKLCADAQVPAYEHDVITIGRPHLNCDTLTRRKSATRTPIILQDTAASEQPPGPAPTAHPRPARQPTARSDSTYAGYGTAEWLAALVMEKEEANLTQKKILARLDALEERVARMDGGSVSGSAPPGEDVERPLGFQTGAVPTDRHSGQ